MVEARSSSINLVPATNLFKFCYIMRGIPGSGKSTVAKQLAGENGVVLNLDQHVVRHATLARSGQSAQEADSLVEI